MNDGRERPPPQYRKIILVGSLGALVVVAAVAIVLVFVLRRSGSSSGTPDSPQAAAQDWINAHLAHDEASFRALSCSGASDDAATFDMTVGAAVTKVVAQRPQRDAPTVWHVELEVIGPGQRVEGTYTVSVRQRDGKYLVC